MRLRAQRVQHQYPKPFQQLPTLFRDPAYIGAIRDITNAKSQNVELRVLKQYRHNPFSQDFKRLAVLNASEAQLWENPGRQTLVPRRERVGKRLSYPLFHFARAIKWKRPAEFFREQPHVIE